MSEQVQPSQPASMWIIPDAAHLEALAEFAAGAGHEINNPLATIIGRAQQLLKDERDPQRRQMLQSIGAQAYRVRDMIGDTMLFGRPPTPELQEVRLSVIVEEVVSRQADQTVAAACTVECQIPPEITLQADPAQMSIVVSELLRNCRQASLPEGGTIVIRAARHDSEIQIEFVDHGRGFTEPERIHAFDPFFSGRQAGRGLGFGLPKCWQIVRQHAGRIEIESCHGGPTVARVFWPVEHTVRRGDLA